MDLNKGVPTLFAYCEKTDLEIFLYIQAGYVPLDGLCLDFFRDFYDFFRGVCGANHLKGIYSISGLKYFL